MTTRVPIRYGGTGANTAANARIALGVAPTESYDQANSAYTQANSAYAQANLAYAQANTARSETSNTFATINTNILIANTQANNAYAQANAAYNQANSAYGQSNSAYTQANSAYGQSNSAYTQANTATTAAGNAYNQANAAYTQANSAYGQANAAYIQANAAYTAANNSNLKSGGLITGTLNVTNDMIVGGNLYLSGNTTYINVATYQVNDPLIYLAANNNLTDSVEIGLIGAKNTSGTYSHTGLARNHIDGKWVLFDGLPEEGHINNIINFANTYLATLRANVEANSITLGGNTVGTAANITLAYNQANAAYTQANTGTTAAGNAYNQANAAYTQANTATTAAGNAYNQANTATTAAGNAYNQANTATTAAGNAYNQANSAYTQANAAYTQANTATTAAGNAYGQANVAYTQANAAYTQANTATTAAGNAYGQANAAYTQANTATTAASNAYNQANLAYLAANNNIVDIFSNSGLVLANSANITFNNTASINASVTANGTYGSNIAFSVNTSAIGGGSLSNIAVSSNSGSTVSANALNFVNSSTVTITVTPGVNGNANISFTSAGGTGGSTNVSNTVITRNQFTGTGACTVYTLTMTPETMAHTLVFVDRVFQLQNAYTLNGNQLQFVGAPDNGSSIEVYTYGAAGGSAIITPDVFTANGSQTVFTLSQPSKTGRTFVFVDGVSQRPNTDFQVNSTTLTMNVAPSNGSIVEVRGFALFNTVDINVAPVSLISDKLTGTGACTIFNLSQTGTTDSTFVFVNGVAQKPTTDYSVSSNVITFTTPPASGSIVEVRTVGNFKVIEPESRIDSDVFTGTGACTSFTLTNFVSTKKAFVYIDGVAQKPFTDYSVSGQNLVFTEAPPSNSSIEVRTFAPFAVADMSRTLIVYTRDTGSGSSGVTIPLRLGAPATLTVVGRSANTSVGVS